MCATESLKMSNTLKINFIYNETTYCKRGKKHRTKMKVKKSLMMNQHPDKVQERRCKRF